MKMKKRQAALPILSFLVTFGLLLILMRLLHLAPFGGSARSWASMDADIQYLDFFAYLKDVLEGKQSISYSFSNLLGQSGIALFSYYLASPVNLLLLFFKKSELNSFFDIAVAIKLSLSALTMSVFLLIRFKDKASSFLIFMLSLCYAFMEYNIAQSSNIMWLDGVYMLPLMMAGVYLVVSSRRFVLLSVSVGLSIIFNWYTGAINCLFSVIWFVFEYLLYVQERDSKAKLFIRGAVTYILSMLLGVMLSAALFLPNVMALREGKGSTFDWAELRNEFLGNPLTAVHQYALSGTSWLGNVSLFCGSIVLVGCIGIFVTKIYKVKQKLIFGGLLSVCFLMFYWRPLYFVFSLFKSVGSYWYRYGYVGSFAMIVVAACFYIAYSYDVSHVLMKAVFAYAILFLILIYIKPLASAKLAVETVLFITGTAAVVVAWYYYKDNCRIYRLLGTVLCLVSVTELSYNAALITSRYWDTHVQVYKDYVTAEDRLVRSLQSQDSGIYRISQTMTRKMQDMSSTTANYNESLAYNYKSAEGYSSSQQLSQSVFLDHLGYRAEGAHIIVVKNTSIVSADALLGVKYVLSPYSINGLQKEEQYGTTNKKEVYANPYVLPMAFTITSTGTFSTDAGNPFAYQNALYSYLLGRDVKIFVPADFDRQDDGNNRTWSVSIPDGSYALYGNLPWSEQMETTLNLNDAFSIPYSQWLSQSVFYVPTAEGDGAAKVSLSSDKLNAITDEQFYLLDLDTLKEVTDELKAGNTVSDLTIENGQVSCTVQAGDNRKLFTSVPYEKGWTVSVNSQTITPETMDDCLMVIPLEEGENHIEMTYSVPGGKEGIMVSVAGAILVILLDIVLRRKSSRIEPPVKG